MKKNYLLYLAFSLSLFVFSCNKDEGPKADPIIGTWEADKIRISDLPEKYSATEGATVLPEVFGILQYQYVFKSDKTFTWEYKGGDGSVFEAEGAWEKADSTYTLDFDQGDALNLTLSDEELKEVVEDVPLTLRDPNDEEKVDTVNATITYIMEKQ